MAWPVTFNGRTYTLADFANSEYVNGIPDLMQDAATHFANGYTGVSTTSLTVGTGTKTFTTDTNRLFGVGQPVVIANTANPSTIYMDGRVTAYNPSTGAMTVVVATSLGSGTLTAWTITIGGARVSATLPLAVNEGGTGAITGAAAQTNLGISAVAQTLNGQTTQTLMRTTGLGFTAVGEALSIAANTGAGRTALGAGVFGSSFFLTADQAAALTALGATSVGTGVFQAADQAAGRTALGLGALATATSVTYSQIQNVSAYSVFCRAAGTTGVGGEVVLGTNQIIGRLGGNIQAIGIGGSGTNVAQMSSSNTFSAAQVGAISSVSYSASVALDMATSNNFSILLTGNMTLANPTNEVAGQSGMIILQQDGTGSRIITFGSEWWFPNGGTEPTLSTGANRVDVLCYTVMASGQILCNLIRDFQ